MYFTYGWPKILRVPQADPSPVAYVSANRDKIIFALLTDATLSIWTSKPCLPVTSYERSKKSVEKLGKNISLVWKPDSTGIVVMTSCGYLLFYVLGTGSKNLYEQVDSHNSNLRRESDELYLKEPIPDINAHLVAEVAVKGQVIGSVSLFRDELMVSTDENHILRYRWDGTINNDFCIDLRRIPFSLDQQASRAVPITDSNVYPVDLHYSPLIGGFSLVLSDGRAAFLTASTKGYDPNSVQGIWTPNLDDATCSNVNHKYRLLSFGRKNSETAIYSVDDQTGGLQNLFNLKLSSKDFPGSPGPVRTMAWTPDGCGIAVSWERGGFAVWSVFGSLLTCSWAWTGELSPYAQKLILSFDWAAEGYQLWMSVHSNSSTHETSLENKENREGGLFGVLSFLKSSLTVNPSMSQIEHLYLVGEDRVLVSFTGESALSLSSRGGGGGGLSKSKKQELVNPLGNNKNWVVVMIPNAYVATNWPIRYTAMDPGGLHISISGRYGLAHYSIVDKKWKLFGNEAQERDFVVVGGMMWWDSYLVVAVYDISKDRDEIRFYPRDGRLDNKLAHVKRLFSQIMLLSIDRDKLLVFAADATLAIFQLNTNLTSDTTIDPCEVLQTIDIGALCVHPACVISVYLTTLKTSFSSSDSAPGQEHSVIINVSGRLMILHHEFLVQEFHSQRNAPQYITPTVLASCVEMVWLPRAVQGGGGGGLHLPHNPYLSEALWLYCGQEMRVWLPLREKSQSSVHTFISNRIMLGFPVSIYPLTILFEKAIILGAENDSLSYTTGTGSSPDPYGAPNAIFPFCILQRTSQVYLHQILRQLIRRNLGYYAWEIARSCSKLPYFPHSLELLLHEVLEEEATSKEPIPNALLPSIIEFVKEFPVYLRAVGQCARKTELALWPHLFSVAGRPRVLFDDCLTRGELDIAATYLLVIQNLESPVVSKKFAIQLLDRALEAKKWDLVKDLLRFLKAIEPSESNEPHRASIVKFNMQSPPVSPNEFDISMVLGTMQVPRMRSLSTSVVPKLGESPATSTPHHGLHRASSDTRSSAPAPSPNSVSSSTASGGPPTDEIGESEGDEERGFLYVDALVERHGRRLLNEGKLRDLGHLTAHLDFHLVTWLRKERKRRGVMIEDFVAGLKMIHAQFNWPYPQFVPSHSRTPSSDSSKFASYEPSSPLKPLAIDVHGNRGSSRNGLDSGYNSTPGNHAAEARLLPHQAHSHSHLALDFESLSVLSEESVLIDQSPLTPSDFSQLLPSSSSVKASVINSSKTAVELRFMQQIMWEAGILDWSLLLSIALKDAVGVVRTVNSCRDQTPDVIRNLRDGLMNLALWANTQCMGYKTFISGINTQVSSVLSKLISACSQPHPPPHPSPGDMTRRRTEPSLGINHKRETDVPHSPLSRNSVDVSYLGSSYATNSHYSQTECSDLFTSSSPSPPIPPPSLAPHSSVSNTMTRGLEGSSSAIQSESERRGHEGGEEQSSCVIT